ncbi:MAG: hypothetical protein CL678_04800 [Bdellovibrionaceae bacterium]|nr:hypothetical protein [Pseudobdellovibrionaceae bacterium]
MRFLLIVSFLFLSQNSFAHPMMIRHGYTTCVTCHRSPLGGSLLTDYGKGIAASLSISPSEYDPEEKSSFEKTLTLNGRIQHGLQFRGVVLDKNGEWSAFPMQLDYLNFIDFGKGHGFQFEVGRTPNRSDGTRSFLNTLLLRRAVYSYRWKKKKRGDQITIGRDYLPYGIRIDDHRAYIRFRNRQDVSDVVSTIRYDFWRENDQSTFFLGAPSGQEVSQNGEWSLGGRYEYYLDSHFSLGGIGLFAHSEVLNRTLLGLFSRYGNEQYGVLSEYDFNFRNILNRSDESFFQHSFYLRPFYYPVEFLEIAFIGELLYVQSPFLEFNKRLGLGLDLKILRNLTFKTDFRKAWNQSLSEDLLMAQLFLNF